MPVPGRYGILHIIVPSQNLTRLLNHGFRISLPERNCPWQRGQSVAAYIKCEEIPEFLRYVIIEVSVHHARREKRRFLSTPDYAVKLLPWIAEVAAVEIDDIKTLVAFLQF